MVKQLHEMTESELRNERYKIDQELSSRSNKEIEVIKVEWGCAEYYFLNEHRGLAFDLIRKAVNWFEKSNKDEKYVYLSGISMHQVHKKERDLEILLDKTEKQLKEDAER